MDPSVPSCEQFQVRAARPDDVPSLVRLSFQLAVSQKAELMFRATQDDFLRDGFGPNPRFSAFVAEGNQGIVGMITYSDRCSTGLPPPSSTSRTSTWTIDTAPAASERLARVAAEATARGLPLIELTMCEGNPAAKIYRRCGFSRVPHIVTFAVAGKTLAALAQRFAEAATMAVGM